MLVVLLACAPPEAESGSVLLVPDDLRLTWTDALADEDAVGGVAWLNAEVLDPDGRPADGVRVDVTSGWRGAWVAAADAVGPDDGSRCTTPCEAWTDEADGRVWLSRPASSAWALWDEPSSHGWLAATTDADGVLGFAVFVDTLPDSGAAVPIYVTIADQTQSFEIGVRDGVVDSP